MPSCWPRPSKDAILLIKPGEVLGSATRAGKGSSGWPWQVSTEVGCPQGMGEDPS